MNLYLYRHYTSEENRQSMVEFSLYRNTIRKKKYAYDKKQTMKLENARLTNANFTGKCLRIIHAKTIS